VSADENTFTTEYRHLKGMDYIFLSLDRTLTGKECEELAVKYFETIRTGLCPDKH
jgi:hypothetical protein